MSNSDADKAPTEPSAPAQPTAGTTVLRVESPFFCTGFNFPREGETTLVIDRAGVEVPSEDVETLVESAALRGVTLTEVN